MDNLGAIGGPLLALGLIALVSVRTAILISVIPGLLATLSDHLRDSRHPAAEPPGSRPDPAASPSAVLQAGLSPGYSSRLRCSSAATSPRPC